MAERRNPSNDGPRVAPHGSTPRGQFSLDLTSRDVPTARPRPRPRRDAGARRLAVAPEEAAAMIGVSRSHFYEHVAPELRVVRSGRRRLVPVTELERWLERNAARGLE
jgi:excisionase family DNA binding protein